MACLTWNELELEVQRRQFARRLAWALLMYAFHWPVRREVARA